MRIVLTLFFLVQLSPVLAQSWRTAFLRSNFEPLLADPKEPRIAALAHLGDTGVLLNIGGSFDLLQIDTRSDSVGVTTLGFGADFGTFSLLRRLEGFKFPVDAADYMFGVNLSWRMPLSGGALPVIWASRVRLSHISAHLVDGSFNLDQLAWQSGRLPFTFSREFVQLTLALMLPTMRLYIGYEWLFNSVPVDVARHSAQAGVEVFAPLVLPVRIVPFAAIDVRLSPIWRRELERSEGYGSTLSVQIGVKTGALGARGLRLTYHYYSGLSWRGMYFGDSVTVSAIGLMIDL
ncbi:MAG: DUF1207 domain-containing protein [Chloroherpetonaceae bacterium]|nr:DUF1207 domain-containing protein [Chloroherpetonaceae bacterium]